MPNITTNHAITYTNISITLSQISLKLHELDAAIGGKSFRKRFWKNSSQCRVILLQVKLAMASFRDDNSDVTETLIVTNFHLYLIQLWWQFFQIFVYGDVVYDQTWALLTLKNCIEPP